MGVMGVALKLVVATLAAVALTLLVVTLVAVKRKDGLQIK
jgi:hypothetical protein